MFLARDHLTPARVWIKTQRLVSDIDEKAAKALGLGSRATVKIHPRPTGRTEEEAHDLQHHRRRAFGPR
jgi:hypothetical protein